jgi:hypothetical protein
MRILCTVQFKIMYKSINVKMLKIKLWIINIGMKFSLVNLLISFSMVTAVLTVP